MVGIMRAPQSAYNGYRGSQVKSSGVNGVDVGGWKRLSEVAHCIFYAQCSTENCSFVLERMSCLWNILSGLCVSCFLSNACLTMSKLTKSNFVEKYQNLMFFFAKHFCKVKESINSSIYAGLKEVGSVQRSAV